MAGARCSTTSTTVATVIAAAVVRQRARSEAKKRFDSLSYSRRA
jgi:hypothetical protein